MEQIVFFTMNDFQKEGGGTIRMLGIINELAKIKNNIILISNIKDESKVKANVKHISLGYEASREDKRKIQFRLALFNPKKLNKECPELLTKLKFVFSDLNPNSKFIFFEYLDNSIGYWLKMNKIIPGYTNDIHGIASNEFDFQAKKTTSFSSKLFFKLKKNISLKLDKKVFENADGIFYASEAMLHYFTHLYSSLLQKKNYYLPYALNHQNVKSADAALIQNLKKDFGIKESDFVFLFAGAYKETGGIQDLITAFDEVAIKHKQAKLILVGDGPTMEDCKKVAKTIINKDRLFFLGRQPYDYLPSFQEMSQVLVCPDRQNLFSDLIVHVKYLDALVSGKLVINGSFKSVLEINKKQPLSLLFKPSDVKDLSLKMNEAIENYNVLTEKFDGSKQYALQNLTYTNFIKNLN